MRSSSRSSSAPWSESFSASIPRARLPDSIRSKRCATSNPVHLDLRKRRRRRSRTSELLYLAETGGQRRRKPRNVFLPCLCRVRIRDSRTSVFPCHEVGTDLHLAYPPCHAIPFQ